MKATLWLWYLSLASATCTLKYAIWISQDRTRLIEMLGQIIPELDYNDVMMLNPGVNADTAIPGRRYKIPYHVDMKLVPSAYWSEDCPKTLKLGDTMSTRLSVHYQPTSMIDRIDHESPVSKLTQPPTQSETPGDDLILKARSVKTPDGSKTAETSSTVASTTNPHTATGTATSMLCWDKTHPSVSNFQSKPEARVEFARSFCDRLQDVTIDAERHIPPFPYGDTLIGMQVRPSCPNYSMGRKNIAVCREVLENINRKCPKAGGVYSNHCAVYYFVKR